MSHVPSHPAAAPGEQAGDRIDRYTLVEPLGQGGMGTVWLAEQTEPVRRRVALKVIKLGMDTREVVLRFEAERQALALMDHPCIAKVLDGGATAGGRPYFVMERVEGEPITRYCDGERLDVPARLRLFVRVCEAVQHAHHKGVIHRDLKPSNVLVGKSAEGAAPKVIDFGIAKATSAELTPATMATQLGQILGTPAYMAPEQAAGSGQDVDTRADVYSLGVLLYELLTGTLPFDAKRALQTGYDELLRQIREVEPPRPSTRVSGLGETASTVAASRLADPATLRRHLRGDLDWIVMKALEKDRARRYETPSALAEDVGRYLAREPVEAAPPSAVYRVRKFVARRKGLVAAGATIALLLIGGVVGTSWGLVRALDETERADAAAAKETEARQLAEANEARAQAEAERARQAAEQEAVARGRAERMSAFMIEVLQAGDAANGGGREDKTILAAMDDAVADLDAGRFADDVELDANVRDTVARVFLRNGRASDAERLSAEALAAMRALRPVPDEALVVAVANHGNVLRELGRPVEAEPLFREALEILDGLEAASPANRLTCMNHLAATLLALGRLPEVERLHREALALARATPELPSEELAMALQNAGASLLTLGDFGEALELCEEAIALHRAREEGDSPQLAIALEGSAAALSGLGRKEESLARQEEALAMQRRLYSGDNEFVALSLVNLGVLHRERREFEEAERLQLASLEMFRRLSPGGHPDVARGLERLGDLYLAAGRLQDGAVAAEEALALYRALGVTSGAELAKAVHLCAQVRRLTGKPAEAAPLYEEALALYDALGWKEAAVTLDCLNGQGVNHWMLRQHERAIEVFEQVMRGYEASVGPEHPLTAQATFNIGINLKDAGQPAAAVPYLIDGYRFFGNPEARPMLQGVVLDGLRKAADAEATARFVELVVEEDRRDLEPESRALAGRLAARANVLEEFERWAEAEALLREAHAIERAARPEAWQPGALQQRLGAALLRQGRHAEAEEALLAAEARLAQPDQRLSSSGRAALKAARAQLAELCEAQGRADEAAAWRAKLAGDEQG